MRRILCLPVAGLLALGAVTPARAETGPTDAAPGQPAAPSAFNEEMAKRFRLMEEQLKTVNGEVKQLREEHAKEKADSAPPVSPYTEPYAWGDFTWLNGSTRKTSNTIDTKYFTPQFDADINYTYSFNQPIDHTIVGSTATFRHNELELAFVGVGGDFHVGHARGRLFLQYGERAVGVPRNDVSANHGGYDLPTAMRYISEAYAGWHFDKLHGINIDLGAFFSYIGLFSYTQFENWGYQASFTSDNTPWFFVGNRDQLYVTDKFKFELWLINGWQSYGKFNELPGVGFQIDYRPREWAKIILSAYTGTDTQDAPGRTRFHTDNSLLIRYYNRPGSKGLSRIASSLTIDIGFEQGDGVEAFHGKHTSDYTQCTKKSPCEAGFSKRHALL